MDILDWKMLDDAGRAAVLRRPAQRDAAGLLERTRLIVDDVRARGDAALRDYTERLDGVRLESFAVSEQEFADASTALAAEQHQALERAIDTVTRFHELQTLPALRLETAPGVMCERMTVPLDSVGLYVPAGSAPLPSTALMLAVPAKIAGCPVRVMCTPPRPDGTADPAVLVAARLCGIRKVFKLGGAQAVAAMAYGTATVPKVVKIFGPGNSWVTAAKQIVAQDADGAALDMPAGPSEV
ncbi:MAG: histidinol dehydrogenase, partial [Gammaproteobacteria bacterium]|nr:histidinol dehydrogenase [Gammaproteobacteria bacterium]